MQVIKTIKELKQCRDGLSDVGFVPTMGALHAGHLSLIQKSVEENSITFVSIFVNPTQFLEGEDIDSYPNQIEADLDICRRAKVDFVFLPNINEMYEDDEPLIKAPKIKGYILEGEHRPGHFDGVLTVVLKLLNLTRPKNAYFGKKDAQQLYLLQNLVKNFHLTCKLIPCEIVRQSDGLAFSSRNAYLSDKERVEALKLSFSLKKASEVIMRGELNSSIIKEKMLEVLEPLRVDYVQIVDREFNYLENIEFKNSIILVSAFVGKARLIDNMWI